MVFAGSVPELYDRYLVPLIFESYASDLVGRLNEVSPEAVLEVAAGTGAVTRAMAAGLPESTSIVSTDLNQPMLDYAASVGTARPVVWQQADVTDLPFPDGMFDAVVCQFSVMFFPDRRQAFAEIYRVLKPGGVFLFNVWDRIEDNEFAAVVTDALACLFPNDPPMFLARTPHGYHEESVVQADVAAAGFESPARFETREARSIADSCEDPAIAYIQGTPLRNEVEALDPTRLGEATAMAAEAIAKRFGRTEIDGKIRGYVVTAGKPS
jgi:SAM-dependent methyltransferase